MIAIAVGLAAAAGIAVAQQPARHPAGAIPQLPPLEDLRATVERPLFMRDRRPPKPPVHRVVEALPVAVPVAQSPADLTGIISGPDRTYAILTSHATKEVHYLHEGETIEDWMVQEIGPRHVVLRRGPGHLRLDLFDEKRLGATSTPVSHLPTPFMRPRYVPQPPRVRRPPPMPPPPVPRSRRSASTG